MQDLQTCHISCHCPREAVLPQAGHAHQPLFHRFLHNVYILWLLSLPPSCCCFLRQFLKGGSIPEDGQHIPRSPGELMRLQYWQAVLSWEYRQTPRYTRTHRELQGLDILPLFNVFLYHIQSCIYSTAAVTRVGMSCHAMLSSLLLPQSLILLLFPAVGQQCLLSGFALSSWASKI